MIDLVLEHRDAVRIGGRLPIGLLAPIRYMPHVGNDREQTFAMVAEGGGRLLVWRLQAPTADEPHLANRFLIRRLEPDQWTGLLDRTTSVRTVLGEDGSAVVVVLTADGSAGGVEIAPTTVADELPRAALPAEEIEGDDGKKRQHRPAWLGLVDGSLVADGSDEYVAAKQAAGASSAQTVRVDDGRAMRAVGRYLHTTAADGDETIHRYTRRLDVEVTIERHELAREAS